MHTDPAQPALAHYVLRLEGTLESLDERIATLALALGAQLDQAGQLDQWLRHAPDGAPSPTRQGRQRCELRGLLVLRYRMISRYCNELGAPVALQLMRCAEDRMQARGWPRGADGLDVQAMSQPR